MTSTDLSKKAHASQLTARWYSCLRRIKSCRRALTRITAAIVKRLDYCKLAGCTKQTLDKLQRARNCSARVIFGGDSRHRATPLLRNHLHWLQAMERISFKLCLLVYNAIHGMATCYLKFSTNCTSPFRLFSTFLLSIPLLVVIWSYPGVDKATTGQPGILCGLTSSVQSLGTVPHCTFVLHLHYKL